MATIIDGKALSAKIRALVKERVTELKQQGKDVGLAVILIGDDPASAIYVANKEKACNEAGILSQTYRLPPTVSQDEVLDIINVLNNNPKITGILLQMPLPKGSTLDARVLQNAISPAKDVDAFHLENMGRLLYGDYGFLPCTPYGIMELLREYNISVEGKECVIVGRSTLVGKPLAMLLLKENGTVTICHSKTRDLAEVCRRADILVAATGVPKLITADMVKDGAVIIDVGINRVEGSKKITGDVDFEPCAAKASFITPVPGGVGPMTIAMLLKQLV